VPVAEAPNALAGAVVAGAPNALEGAVDPVAGLAPNPVPELAVFIPNKPPLVPPAGWLEVLGEEPNVLVPKSGLEGGRPAGVVEPVAEAPNPKVGLPAGVVEPAAGWPPNANPVVAGGAGSNLIKECISYRSREKRGSATHWFRFVGWWWCWL
jgi:hypothetical protein